MPYFTPDRPIVNSFLGHSGNFHKPPHYQLTSQAKNAPPTGGVFRVPRCVFRVSGRGKRGAGFRVDLETDGKVLDM